MVYWPTTAAVLTRALNGNDGCHFGVVYISLLFIHHVFAALTGGLLWPVAPGPAPALRVGCWGMWREFLALMGNFF